MPFLASLGLAGMPGTPTRKRARSPANTPQAVPDDTTIAPSTPPARANHLEENESSLKRRKVVKGDLYDFTVKVTCADDVSFDIHHGMLCDRSAYFKKLLQADDQANIPDRINLPEIDPDIFEFVKRYIYTGELEAIEYDDHLERDSQLFTQDTLDHLPSILSQYGSNRAEPNSSYAQTQQVYNAAGAIRTPTRPFTFGGPRWMVRMPSTAFNIDSLTLTKLWYMAGDLHLEHLREVVLTLLIKRLPKEESMPSRSLCYAAEKANERDRALIILIAYTVRYAPMAQLKKPECSLPLNIMTELIVGLAQLRDNREDTKSWLTLASDHAWLAKNDSDYCPSDYDFREPSPLPSPLSFLAGYAGRKEMDGDAEP